eukprot:gnl/MRDRNA2_/MRDRNA2_96712_c0_seq1.p1 gnl/MRDRNA2_/MRDRNA2_96712_c0~~gnl/MRDRNA2_/MRDRNA2_96712_c0_seq1.p1  ORF type:complete len:173 (+),score=28.40 gnl/MRDRNA2_/MRDRNA2_96712_c0_seq1:81-599(+)
MQSCSIIGALTLGALCTFCRASLVQSKDSRLRGKDLTLPQDSSVHEKTVSGHSFSHAKRDDPANPHGYGSEKFEAEQNNDYKGDQPQQQSSGGGGGFGWIFWLGVLMILVALCCLMSTSGVMLGRQSRREPDRYDYGTYGGGPGGGEPPPRPQPKAKATAVFSGQGQRLGTA